MQTDLMFMQQTTSSNFAKGEIVLMIRYFANSILFKNLHFYKFKEIFHTFIYIFSKLSAELVYVRRFNPFPHIDAFWRLYSRRILKTWRQKKKLLKTSKFFFCHHVFNSIQLLYYMYIVCFSKSSAADLMYVGKGFKR